MTRPSRDTAAGRVYLDLRARARRDGRGTDEILVLYVLERFLYRLSISHHRDHLILKGGMLLAAYDQRRPTRDVDLLAQATANDAHTVAALIRDVITIDVDDGVVYERERLTTRPIREQERYTAVRVIVPARVGRAQQPLRVDVNVGDPVIPAPVEISYPALLHDPFRLLGYPIETVLAEKLVTMIDRGDTTTRDRDFADVALLIARHHIDASQLAAAINATARHRRTLLRPLSEVLVTLAADRQADWERYVVRTALQGTVPSTYAATIARVLAFADPILAGIVKSGTWVPNGARWRT
jgi:hypothetical protein